MKVVLRILPDVSNSLFILFNDGTTVILIEFSIVLGVLSGVAVISLGKCRDSIMSRK